MTGTYLLPPSGTAPPVAVPSNVVLPSIVSAIEGAPLSGSDGSWDNNPTSFSRSWLVGATDRGASYTPVAGDIGASVVFRVIATNAAGSSAQISSAAGTIQPASVGLPAWIAALPLQQWHRVPGTSMSNVTPSPTPPGLAAFRVSAWCGATANRVTGEYLVAAAGGHGDYAGNEVIGINFSDATPAWAFRRQPSKFTGVTTNPTYAGNPTYQVNGDLVNGNLYLDKRQASAHTYMTTWFLPNLGASGKIVMLGSGGPNAVWSPTPPAEWSAQYPNKSLITAFDLTVNDWDEPQTYFPTIPKNAGSTNWPSHVNAVACQNQATNDIYDYRITDNNGLGMIHYKAATNTWANYPAFGGFAIGSIGIDHIHNRLLALPTSHPSALGSLSLWDTSTGLTALPAPTFGGLGLSELMLANSSGFLFFCEVLDTWVYCFNSAAIGFEIRFINPDTWAVTKPPLQRDPAVSYEQESLKAQVTAAMVAPTRASSLYSPYSGGNGVYNGAQYLPTLGLIVYTHAGNTDMWAIRLHSV